MMSACLSAGCGRRPPAAALILLATLGCGKPVDLPVTHPTSGKVVTANGQPLKGGMIEFALSPPDPTITITGAIGQDGHFTLSTLKGNQKVAGAVEGQYQATVIPPITGRRQAVTPIPLPGTYTIKPGKNIFPDFTLPPPSGEGSR